MIYCPECENRCSEEAPSCPKCGHPLKPQTVIPVPLPLPQPATSQTVVVQGPAWNPGVAAVLSFFIPGLGQLYKAQVFNGLLWFFVVLVGYFFFIIPGVVLHIFCIVGAVSGDPSKQAKRQMKQP